MDALAHVHLAAQYLAMAGKSFLEPKSDDSHTNLGFFEDDKTLRTWNLNDSGIYLAFSFDDFTLRWNTPEGIISFALDGKKHLDVVGWITKMAEASKFDKPYIHSLHYELPYSVDDKFEFTKPDDLELEKFVQLRITSQNALTSFLRQVNLKSDIRIWPHHFDTGAFVVLNDGSGKSVGMGLAIPDSMISEHYFYISGYVGHDGIDTSSFKNLTHGEWKNDGFKGAILKASQVDEGTATKFLLEAFSNYN